MKLNLSRSTVLISSIYTLSIGIVMLILSIFSVVAYQCVFHDGFAASPETYFFHLFYYRSNHCIDKYIDWSLFGLENSAYLNELIELPDQNSIVSRTYKLTIVQLIISSLFTVVSCTALVATVFNIYFVSRQLTYSILFVPYLFVFLISIVFDFVAGTFYADDRFRSQSIDGTMEMLEIVNFTSARPYIEQIDELHRTLPPNVMFYVSTKAMIINIINCFLLFGVIYASWGVVDDSMLLKKKKDDDQE